MTSIHDKQVIVIGAGVFGLCTAFEMACAGLRVAVVDAGKIGGAASGGIVGAMSPHTPDNWNQKKQFQFDALDSAEAFWKRVGHESGLPTGYGRVGRIFPIPDARLAGLAKMREEAAKTIWQGKYYWKVLESHPLIAPKASPFGVVWDDFSARIYPRLACQALAKACITRGVEIFENTPVTQLHENGISGAWGHASAESIILAGGFDGFKLLHPYLGTDIGGGVKGQAAILEADLKDAPQISAEGIYIIPHIDGTVGVGSTSEREWQDSLTTDDALDEVITKARHICPHLKDARVVSRWAQLRPKARKRTPMLGPLDDLPSVYLAMGGYKIGFGLAHKVGEIMRDYALGQSPELPDNFTIAHHTS